MAKKQKTREQKIKSDNRRQSHYKFTPETAEIPSSVRAPLVSSSIKTSGSSYAVSTSGYKYLSGDLWKTVILTTSIILIELTLKLFNKGV